MDFQSRVTAMPVVIDALESLLKDPRFDREAGRGVKQQQVELPSGVQAMIAFVGTIDRPEATQALIELLNGPKASWAMASMMVLGKHQHRNAIDAVEGAAESEFFTNSYGFRFTLAKTLKQMDHPNAWEALARVYDQLDGQLAFRLRQEFETITADDFTDDEARFQSWRAQVGLAVSKPTDSKPTSEPIPPGQSPASLPSPPRLSPSASQASYVPKRHLKPSHYYGIEIHAKRLLFVIDRSGSMNEAASGTRRIDLAKRELVTALQGLDERCQFGILVFDSDVRHWKEDLVLASDSNKRNAIRFVERLSAGSRTNTYGALRRALEFDDQLEAIFLLTDGQPTIGMLTNPTAILIDILRRNEYKHITLNSVAIAVEPLMQSFLHNLTEPSNGEFRSVR